MERRAKRLSVRLPGTPVRRGQRVPPMRPAVQLGLPLPESLHRRRQQGLLGLLSAPRPQAAARASGTRWDPA